MSDDHNDLSEVYGYVPKPIDIDLGVTRRTVKKDARELPGAPIFMYRDMPGLYLGAKGQTVSDSVARDAGFSVRLDRQSAKVAAEVARATEEIRERSAQIEDEIRNSVSEEARSKLPSAPTVVQMPDLVDGPLSSVKVEYKSSEGEPRGTEAFEMVHVGGPRWNVISKSDGKIISDGVRRAEAITVMLEAQSTEDMKGRGAELGKG